MRLSFSSDHQGLREEFEHVFAAEATSARARAGASSPEGWDRALWRQLAELGWLGVTASEAHGGLGQDPLALCLIAEAFGQRLAAIPFLGAALGFADALLTIGDRSLSDALAPGVVAGEVIGALAIPEHFTALDIDDGHASGACPALMDAAATTHILTLAGAGSDAQLILLDVTAAHRERIDSLDRVNLAWAVTFDRAPSRTLARGETASDPWRTLRARYATFMSFVQIGAASAALDMARDHVIQRYAFGRPLGSFQAVKHELADVLAAIEIARSNAWFAAAALNEGGSALAQAGAAARVSATDAHRLAARANVHLHGGLGVTAESDAHLHYRRAQALGLVIGPSSVWRERLIAELVAARAVAPAAPQLPRTGS